MLLEIALLILTLGLARIAWMRWKYDLHKIPSPPASLFLGHLKHFLPGKGEGEVSRVRGGWFSSLGHPRIIKVRILGKPVLYVRDMDCLKFVILSKANLFQRLDWNATAALLLIGNDRSVKSLMNQAGNSPYAKAVRRVYATGFQSKNLKLAIPKMLPIIDKMFQIIEKQRLRGPVDVQKLCVQMSLDMIGVVALGLNLGGFDESRNIRDRLLQVGHIMVQRSLDLKTIFLSKFFPKSQSIQEQDTSIQALTAEWNKLTDEILALDDPADGDEPIWNGLRNLVDPDTNKPIEYKTLRAEIATAVFAGMDTTGHQLAWILAFLASHRRVTDKLLEELRSHGLYGKEAKEVEYEDLSDLAYLSAVIKEGMRIGYVVGDILLRIVPQDMKILGYRVPKGTLISAVGNRFVDSEDDYANPMEFRPERWLSGEDMSKKWYLGFSAGPRDCIGQRLAMLELRLGIVMFVTKYRLSLTVPIMDLLKNGRNGVVIEAADGILLDLDPRLPMS